MRVTSVIIFVHHVCTIVTSLRLLCSSFLIFFETVFSWVRAWCNDLGRLQSRELRNRVIMHEYVNDHVFAQVKSIIHDASEKRKVGLEPGLVGKNMKRSCTFYFFEKFFALLFFRFQFTQNW